MKEQEMAVMAPELISTEKECPENEVLINVQSQL